MSDLASFVWSSSIDAGVCIGVVSCDLEEHKAEMTLSDIVLLCDVVLELSPISLARISSDRPT